MIIIYDARALQNAVFGIEGVRQNPPGTVIEYWRGPADFDPTGGRKAVFSMAMKLYEAGACRLVQEAVGLLGEQPNGKIFEWSYRAVVT